MVIQTKILHHQHSGKLKPHRHTSYAGLFFMLMLCGLALLTITQATYGAHPDPGIGTIGLKGVVPGKAPTVAAVINSPRNGTRFTTIPVPVTGTCPQNTIVEIFKNGIFAGSDYCKDDQTFSIQVDLLIGANDVVAKVFDALDQAGPDSNTITLYYDVQPAAPLFVLSAPNALPDDYQQFVLRTNAVYRGSFAGDPVKVVIDVIGGIAPYALIIDWGDGKTDLVSRENKESFTTEHIFGKPGVYQAIIKGTDSKNKTAYLQTTILVNGQSDLAAGTTVTTTATATKSLLLAWPMWILLFLVFISFWLGERHEKTVLRRRGQLVTANSGMKAGPTKA